MQTEKTDVCVIGGGPSGTTAAITLAEAGFGVVLFECRTFPRHRPGESFPPGVEPLLKQLGVQDDVQKAKFRRFSGITSLWGRTGPPTYRRFSPTPGHEWLGFHAERSQFDGILLRRASGLGTRICQPCRVKSVQLRERSFRIAASDKNWDCQWVIDASGQAGVLPRAFEIDWRLHSGPLFARYGYVNGLASEANFDIPLIRRDGTGWTWMARIADKTTAWVRVETADVGAQFVPPELAHLSCLGPTRGADVTWRIRRRVSGPHWFLTGDSAMVLDPSSSHGVLKSMLSGMCAASLIVQSHVDSKDPRLVARAYSHWLRDGFLKDVHRLKSFYRGQTQTDQFRNPVLF